LTRRLIVGVVSAVALLLPTTAQGAFAGANGKIAYVDGPQGIWTMNPDGSSKTQITTGADAAPAWSPDGTRIAFHRKIPACSGPCSNIWIADADGSNAALVIPGAQYPSWSPDGGKLVFMAGPSSGLDYSHIYRANVDGTGRTLLFDFEDYLDFWGIGAPAWAPDETATIAFHEGTLTVSCNPDHEECANFYPEDIYYTSSESYSPYFTGRPEQFFRDAGPNWSPDGERLAFFTPQWGGGEFPGDAGGEIGVINRDGSDRELLTPGAGSPGGAYDQQPAWAPDGSSIVFARNGDGIHVMNADGTGDGQISTTGSDPDWQPLPVSSHAPYVRPKAAPRIRLSLVPAYRECTAPNRIHGPSLAFGSCAPPLREGEGQLTVGGATDAAAKSIGQLRLVVLSGSPGPPDDQDVQVKLSVSNVMVRSSFQDHTGVLQAVLKTRITDRGGAFGSLANAVTMMDFPYEFTVACTATADTTVGATCSANTTFDAIVPGSGYEGGRGVWELDRFELRSGGPTNDAELFLTQGVFVP
jgi:hypothetical protein